MTRVCLDANAVIDYVRECTLYNLGMDSTGRKADMLRKRLGPLSDVFVAQTAAREAERNLFKDLKQKLGRATALEIEGDATDMLYEYCEEFECRDEREHVPVARKMYAVISGDPGNEKFSTWKRKKRANADAPALGRNINDLVILSTAVHYAKRSAAEFWTHDMDFTLFADEIYRTFGLIVVDTYRLGRRFL